MKQYTILKLKQQMKAKDTRCKSKAYIPAGMWQYKIDGECREIERIEIVEEPILNHDRLEILASDEETGEIKNELGACIHGKIIGLSKSNNKSRSDV